MFGFSITDGLWKLLKPLLKAQLGKAFGPIADELKGLLHSTLNDLEAEIVAQYVRIGMLQHSVTARVKRTDVEKDPKWQEILRAYANKLMEHAMSRVLKRMAENGTAIAGPHRVIDVADHLAINVAGKDGFHSCVILFTKAGEGAELQRHLKRARKIWNARNKQGYDLSVREYDGFTAP